MFGDTVSTVNVTPLEAGLVLPALSVAVAVSVCGPLLRASVGVKLQVPPAPTVVVPMGKPSLRIVIVAPISPVPLSAGRVSLVV
ncbi:hypothetical protein D3C81_1880650 [compost metagenome]